PHALIPGQRPDQEPASLTLAHFVFTSGLAAAIGALVWAWRGGTRGYGFSAACSAASLSLAIELARWFKPGQLPALRAPLIAAVVAPATWRLLRLLPNQPVTPLPRRGPWAVRFRSLLRCGFMLGFLGGAGAAACLVWEIDAV